MAWTQQGGSYPYTQQTVPPPAFYSGPNYPTGGYPGGPPPPPPGIKPFPVFSGAGSAPGMSGGHDDYGTNDPLSGRNYAFNDKTIRNGFIRKVYSILMCQLSISAAFIAVFVYNDSVKKFAQNNFSLLIIAFIVTIVCLLAMSCCESARRQPPTNYIFLLIFTVAESFLLGVICSYYRANEVLLAVAICAVICFGLTVFAFQTKIDFTAMGAFLFVAVLILMIFGFVLMFWRSDTARLVYSCFGALIFSGYLIYDTQMMMGGDHKYSISPEEYVFAALNLYIDIVQLFMYILSIIGSSRD